MWQTGAVAAAVCLVTGLLPLDAAGDVTRRMAPILLFLVAITVLAELAEVAKVFDVAALHSTRLARGRTAVLFLLVALLATITTVLLGLDTTAVLLTPVVLSMSMQLNLPAMPFALLTVWLANTASLLLPVSNLTNLLALHTLGLEPHQFAARMWAPAVVAVVLTVLLVGVRYRRALTTAYTVPARPAVEDRVLLVASAVACLGLVPPLLLGADPTWVVTVAAGLLAAVFLVRRRDVLRFGLVPWRLAVFVLGLALAVETVLRHGGDRVVSAITGEGTDLGSLLQVAGVGAVSSNVINNLPAYLVIEPAAVGGGDTRLFALLLGTNLGPLVLLWGSLATLLWRERCRARGVVVSARQFASFGLVGVPVVLISSTLALAACSGPASPPAEPAQSLQVTCTAGDGIEVDASQVRTSRGGVRLRLTDHSGHDGTYLHVATTRGPVGGEAIAGVRRRTLAVPPGTLLLSCSPNAFGADDEPARVRVVDPDDNWHAAQSAADLGCVGSGSLYSAQHSGPTRRAVVTAVLADFPDPGPYTVRYLRGGYWRLPRSSFVVLRAGLPAAVGSVGRQPDGTWTGQVHGTCATP
jgi:arsenical pump membrane protein